MLNVRLAGLFAREYVQLQKCGLHFSPRGFATPATTAAAGKAGVAAPPPLEQKKGLLDTWGEFHVPTGKYRPWPKDYKEFPERDLVNFPHPVQPYYGPKVRLAFIPDSWFQFFYNKTGVTGPYLFGWGLVAFMMQKEILVWEHELNHLPPLLFIIWVCYKVFGSKLAAFLEKDVNKDIEAPEKLRVDAIKGYADSIKEEKELEDSYTHLVPAIVEAKKENVALQLEAAYRERLSNVHKEVKRRLDFLADTEEAKRRFEQRHMVSWIVDQVKKSITPQQEKAALSQCIADLKSMAAAV